MGRRLTLPRLTIGYLAFTIGVGVAGAYAFTLVYRSTQVYGFLKSDHRGLRGHLHRYDPDLGYSALPGASGFELLPGGAPQPVSYDQEGLRVPLGQETRVPRKRPFVLTLGCSFTFGDATLAEDTYAEVSAAASTAPRSHAGKGRLRPGQMLILARRLIPRYQPDVVVIQFSPWLARRAMSGFANVTFGVAPVPYLTQDTDGRVTVVPPIFRARRCSTCPSPTLDRPDRGPGEFLSFLFEAGAPLFVPTICRLSAIACAGERPPPSSRARPRAAQSRRLRGDRAPRPRAWRPAGHREAQPSARDPLPGDGELSRDAVLVNAQAALDAHATDYADYQRQFAHWRGSPPSSSIPTPTRRPI